MFTQQSFRRLPVPHASRANFMGSHLLLMYLSSLRSIYHISRLFFFVKFHIFGEFFIGFVRILSEGKFQSTIILPQIATDFFLQNSKYVSPRCSRSYFFIIFDILTRRLTAILYFNHIREILSTPRFNALQKGTFTIVPYCRLTILQ